MELSGINTRHRYFGLQLGANPQVLRTNCSYLASSRAQLKFMVIKLKNPVCGGVFH